MNDQGRALVLDFGGVISKTVFETHDQSERALGLPAGTLTWRGPFDPASDALWRDMQADRISERDYWARRARETGERVGETWTTMAKFVAAIRGDDPAAVVRPEAVAAIDGAKRAGRKLAVLSNELDLFYGAGFRHRLPLLAAFDAIVDATYTRILKPDRRAYELVAAELELPAESCVFVDDQLRNVRGAAAAGMRAVHFDVTDPGGSYDRALALVGL